MKKVAKEGDGGEYYSRHISREMDGSTTWRKNCTMLE